MQKIDSLGRDISFCRNEPFASSQRLEKDCQRVDRFAHTDIIKGLLRLGFSAVEGQVHVLWQFGECPLYSVNVDCTRQSAARQTLPRCRSPSSFSEWLILRGVSPEATRDQLFQLKGLILAQNERWRRGLGMQVEREALV